MLAFEGQPSHHGYYACMVYSNKGALRRNCRQKYGETFFPFCSFLVGILGYGLGVYTSTGNICSCFFLEGVN